MLRSLRIPFGLLLLSLLLVSLSAMGGTFNVDTTLDTVDAAPGNGLCSDAGGDCSLRAAVMEANVAAGGPHTINLPAGTYTLAIAGAGEDAAATGDLDLAANMTIDGAGAATTTINANAIDRVFDLPFFSPSVTIRDVSITGGSVADDGGGIRNLGTMTIIASEIHGNSATATHSGGGIHSWGTLVVTDSTIRANTSSLWGGGVHSFCAGGSTSNAFRNTTFSGNTATGNEFNGGQGGGYFASCSNVPASFSNVTIAQNTAVNGWGGGISGGIIQLKNSILDGNVAPNSPDCNDGVTSLGYNLVSNAAGCDTTWTTGDVTGSSAQLGALAYNGGGTRTRSIPASSPAFDGGNPAGCTNESAAAITTDQRGVSRPQAARCDIGAFEQDVYPQADLSIAKSGGAFAVAGSTVTYTIDVENSGPDNATGVTVVESPAAGLTFVSGTGGCAGGFPWVIGTLNDDASVACTATFSVASSVAHGASLDNTVTVGGDTFDPAAGNDEATASTSVSREIDLAVSVAESVDPVVAASGPGNLVYTVTLAQNGPSDASALEIDLSSTLPAGVTIDSVVPSAGSYTAPTWSLTALAAGGSATLTVTLTVDGSTAPGTDVISLGASVSGWTETRLNTGDDSDTEATSVVSPADVSGTKSVQGSYGVGGEVTYTIVLTNAGPGAQRRRRVHRRAAAGAHAGRRQRDVRRRGLHDRDQHRHLERVHCSRRDRDDHDRSRDRRGRDARCDGHEPGHRQLRLGRRR